MKYILYLICLLNLFVVFSQQKKIDSLQKILQLQDGISKVDTLNELAWVLRKGNDSIAVFYALEALNLSKKNNYYLGVSNAYNRLGNIAKRKGFLLNAIEYYNKALQIDKQQNYIYGIARANNELGNVYEKQTKKLEALTHYNRSLQAFEKIKKFKQATTVAINIGKLYLAYNTPKEALSYYLRAFELSKKINSSTLTAYCYKNLGIVHQQLKNYKEALIYFKKAKTIYEDKKQIIKMADIQMSIASTYDYLNENEMALMHYYKALSLTKNNDTKYSGYLYHNLATLYRKIGKKDSSLYYYNKGINEFKLYKNNKKLAVSYNNIGNLYFDNKQYNNALNHLTKSLDLQHQNNDSLLLGYTYTSLANVYYKLNKHTKAYAYKDSSYLIEKGNFKKIKQADRYEVAYANEKKKLEATLHRQKILEAKTTQKNTYIIALVITVILLIFLFFYVVKAKKQQKEKLIITHEKEKQIQTLINEQDIRTYNAMIDGKEKESKRIAQELHDNIGSKLALVKIFYQSIENNLNSNDIEYYEKANLLLDETCKDVRNISHSLETGFLSNFGLVSALKELTQNYEIAYNKSSKENISILLTFHRLDNRLKDNIERHVYRIIQELLNNILKHAKATEVHIQLLKFENKLNIIVEDNGVGFDTSKQQNGLGLKSIQQRVISEIKGNYLIDSGKGNGTTVTIDIPT
ncbi:tetratricopeptide repeat-containing sensor histidine kinase [Tenacibaculum sp. M341]|uniref:tetratricopeptide repeat-containing sensor histidine kinase n=1 Tax=Tenacibaculum sp. M341 TaxID=2530339 RepID=UPI0010512C15|nr:tetratricopeptide repeat protein [Tenacibaculum sp. M341]TCI95095.1 tetratricopeptide repeat protein [Tenacibaculum sp. M341]